MRSAGEAVCRLNAYAVRSAHRGSSGGSAEALGRGWYAMLLLEALKRRAGLCFREEMRETRGGNVRRHSEPWQAE